MATAKILMTRVSIITDFVNGHKDIRELIKKEEFKIVDYSTLDFSHSIIGQYLN
jgi:hypothetical protein